MMKRIHKTQVTINLSLWVDDELTTAQVEEKARNWIEECIQGYLLACNPTEEHISHKTLTKT